MEWYTQHTLHCGIYVHCHCHASCNWCANQVTLDSLSLGPIANQKNVVVMKYLVSTNLIIWLVQIASGKKVPESWKNVILALLQILANYQLQLKEKSYFQFWGVSDVNDHFELHLPCIQKLCIDLLIARCSLHARFSSDVGCEGGRCYIFSTENLRRDWTWDFC